MTYIECVREKDVCVFGLSFVSFVAGTYFILYDFIDYFEKDGPSFLQRDKYHDIVNTIFKNMSRLEKDAIVFQVRACAYLMGWVTVVHFARYVTIYPFLPVERLPNAQDETECFMEVHRFVIGYDTICKYAVVDVVERGKTNVHQRLLMKY